MRISPSLELGYMSTIRPVPAYLAGLSFAKRLEVAAAMVVASCTGLTVQSLDPGGGSRQLPDFDMVDDQGQVVGALEVTTTTVAERAQFAARARNLSWEFDELQWVWLVHVTGALPPREIHGQIAPLLRSLEQAGQTGEWIPKLPGLAETDPGALPRSLAAVGVRRACAVHRVDSEPGRVLITQAGPVGPFSVGTVVNAAECELQKPDNIAKLSGRRGRTELCVAGRWYLPSSAVHTRPPRVREGTIQPQVALVARRGDGCLGCGRVGGLVSARGSSLAQRRTNVVRYGASYVQCRPDRHP